MTRLRDPLGPDRPAAKEHGGCTVGELFQMLGQPHMLGVLHVFTSSERPVRFRELQSQLPISPKTLSARLRSLVEGGFLTRHAYSEIPPRVEYEATSKVRELIPLFEALEKWAGRNTLTATPVVSVVGRPSPRGSRAGAAPLPRAGA
jgi:DNA-binding HxlR family transcriptional regulator